MVQEGGSGNTIMLLAISQIKQGRILTTRRLTLGALAK